MRGTIFEIMGKRQEAFIDYSRATTSNPNDGVSLMRIANLYKGKIKK